MNSEFIIEKVLNGNIDAFRKCISIGNQKQKVIDILRTNYKGSVTLRKVIDTLIDYEPFFCFMVVYDMDEYESVIKDILTKTDNSICLWDRSKIKNALKSTSWMKKYILENFDNFQNDMFSIIEYVCSDIENNKDLIEKINNSSNPNLKLVFYSEVALKCDSYISYLMPNILSLLEENVELDEFELSRFADRILRKGNYKDLFKALKNYILNKYERNRLAGLLVSGNDIEKEELTSDLKTYYDTSFDARLQVFQKYKDSVKTKIFDDLKRHLSILNGNDSRQDNWRIQNIFFNGLDLKMEEYMDLYLSKSKSNEVGFIGSGTTTSCYRLGDYVLKISDDRHSDVKCPNLYLILANLEEYNLINHQNVFIAGLAIQKYLGKSADNLPRSFLDDMKKMFNEAGYEAADVRLENCRVLDSYKDADCDNPDLLPLEFKRNPVVLIDRELVFPIEKKELVISR